MFITVAMPNIGSIGPYHLIIYSSSAKNHSIFSFKLMQGSKEKATFNLNTGEWQAIRDIKALKEVQNDIDSWLKLEAVQSALAQQCDNALNFRPVSAIDIPIERKELRKYLKNKGKTT